MISGYPYFWKHPTILLWNDIEFLYSIWCRSSWGGCFSQIPQANVSEKSCSSPDQSQKELCQCLANSTRWMGCHRSQPHNGTQHWDLPKNIVKSMGCHMFWSECPQVMSQHTCHQRHYVSSTLARQTRSSKSTEYKPDMSYIYIYIYIYII